MGSSDCLGLLSLDECKISCDADYEVWEEKKLDSTMPWIGMYIAAASVVCSLAMAADAFCGFRNKRLWFPCKYFSLNATSLTLLAVTLKLPVDITATALGTYDKIAWISSPILMSTSMGNFMTALGSINGAHIRMPIVYKGFRRIDSVYDWSIDWIIVTQSIGVAVGTIAPALRWFTAASFKSSELGSKSFKDEFKIETYWIQRLVDWRERSLPIHVPHHKCRKLFQDAKWLILNFCIGVQILIVLVSKLFLLISASFLHHINRLKIFINDAVKIKRRSESGEGTQPDLTQYVLLLEGEAKVPKKILKNICNEVDKLMQKSIRKHPKNLIELLNKSTNFNGVREFDSDEIPRLNSMAEPPNCWSLTVVTLTSIAISLPNIPNDRANQLVRCVGEGLLLLKLIEKSLDRNGALVNIRNAANVVWVKVELYRKWLDKDLHKSSLQGRTSEETLEELSNESKRTVMEFHRDVNDFLMENPLNWPVKIIAANSMYRTSQTILMSLGNYRTNDPGLFDHLSLMIADILAASLTNLPHVITTKCHNNSLKEGEKSIRQGN
ncbi:uncharacterized protein LOC111402213 [Olea europaea var. sylvestris]|uniref:uncharacterized protein LOC111402213 n=1 Tax=Olea europaea var. sylvestris TaxID=158386 RepID=UPI000C1D1101|nr:uncharacterized protein LOC111402213 [Olea europaea var. sylvestris]